MHIGLSAKGFQNTHWHKISKSSHEEENDLFCVIKLHGQSSRASECYGGVGQSGKAHQEQQRFLHFLRIRKASWPVPPHLLTWLSQGNTCSHANENSPCVTALGESY